MTDLPKPLQAAWDAAEANPGKSIPVGRQVVCDCCNEDFTDRPDVGGMIFGFYGYCPACTRKSIPEIIKFGEEHFIRARCPSDVSFADFVRAYRGPDAAITVYHGGRR